MANQEHLDILKQGVTIWNQWRQEHLGMRPNLSFANLSGANLREANLNGTDLMSARLSFVDLTEARLTEANLFRANLREANLTGALQLHIIEETYP